MPGILRFAVAAIAVACGGEPAPRDVARAPLIDTSGSGRPVASDVAVFRYHPARPPMPIARTDLPGGRVLFTGHGGERWVVPAAGGLAETTADIAPEDLVAIVPRNGKFLFVGKSGSSYEADAPLGPFVRSAAPLEPLVHVRVAGSALIGVRRDGTLVASPDAGTTWSRVGPTTTRFEDVAVRADGRGLALAVPEALFETRDFGASWTPQTTPKMGAAGFADDAKGEIVLATALGNFRWDPGAPAPFSAIRKSTAAPNDAPGGVAPLGPSANALAEGRAVVIGDRYVELRPERAAWRLVSGRFDAPLAITPLGQAGKGCADVRLTGFGQTLYLACVRDKNETTTQPVSFERSADGGRTWQPEPYVAEGRTGELSLAVGVDDQLLVSGICPQNPPTAHGPGCIPVGVHEKRKLATDGGSSVSLVPAATPSLVRSALGLAVSDDGKTAYAIGRHSKGETLAVFVSRDGGATFEAHEIDPLTLPAESEMRARARSSDFDVESFVPGDDGTLAVVVKQRNARMWLVVDADGHATAIARPPADSNWLGAAGQRGLAVNRESRDAYESKDAGASWTFIGKLPVNACPSSGDCTLVSCVEGGCVFGDVLSRVGWGAAPGTAVLEPPAANDHRRDEPRTGTPFSCNLEPGEWKRLPGVVAPPFAEQAAIGKAEWFVVKTDPSSASVSVLHARPTSPVRFDEVTLLAPSKQAGDRAYRYVNQVEGAAALRYPVPSSTSKDGNLRSVELAWDDVLAGRVGRAEIADAGPVRPGDYENRAGVRVTRGTPNVARLAVPDFLSIAEGGLYVRVHQWPGGPQPTFFSDGHATETIPGVTWPSAEHGSEEMVHVGRAHVPLRFFGTTVVRATPSPRGGWAFDAESLGYTDPNAFGREVHVGMAYAGGHAGFEVTSQSTSGGDAIGLLYPFRAEGNVVDEPVRVPTQLDLGPLARACNVSDRSSTPRIVAPFEPGTRRPVLVADAVEPMRVMLTADAVLHGTPSAACAAAYDATAVSWELSATAPKEAALIFPGNPERSFLFRMAEGPDVVLPALEYRSMSCRVDPSAEVPVEIFREKGTLVERR